MLERIRTCSGNTVIYRQGGLRKSAARAAKQPRRGDADRSAPARAMRCRRILQPPGGDDVGAGGAGAAHRRAGDSGRSRCRLPGGRYRLDLRAPRATASRRRGRMRFVSSRSAAPTCWRCMSDAIRISGSGCTAGGATRNLLLPNTRHDDARGRAPAGGFAELARRRRHGASRHRRPPSAVSRCQADRGCAQVNRRPLPDVARSWTRSS